MSKTFLSRDYSWLEYCLLLFGGFSSLLMFVLNISLTQGAQQFFYLADGFLHGQLFFLTDPWRQCIDCALYGSRSYWPLGPFPALAILPFIVVFKFVGLDFYQGYMQVWLVPLVCYLVFRLAKLLKFTTKDSLWFAFAFFTSAFYFVAIFPISYYFSQVIAITLWLATLVEYLSYRRYWLLGLLIGLVFLTRAPSGLGLVFFVIDILTQKQLFIQQRLRNCIQLLVPFLVLVACWADYNYLRFGNIFEQGYSYQLTSLISIVRQYGLFNIIYIPGNLFYMLFSFPLPVLKSGLAHIVQQPFIQPSVWGTSLLITSPYLCTVFVRAWDRTAKCLGFACLVVLTPILFYYGVGAQQYGFRYALDFMPLLYFLFMYQYYKQRTELSIGMRLLMLISATYNVYGSLLLIK